MKAELKFATTTSGEQYAVLHIAIGGIHMKLKWCVISLDIFDQVYMHA